MEFQRAVAEFARANNGQTAEIVWAKDPVNCWQVRLYLRGDDPRRTADPNTHFEPVLLHEWVDPRREPSHPMLHKLRRDELNRPKPGFVALELEEIGVSGLVHMLERGSVLSGRGEHKTAEDGLRHSLKQQEARAETNRRNAQDSARNRFLELRRRVLSIPFLPVGIDLKASIGDKHAD